MSKVSKVDAKKLQEQMTEITQGIKVNQKALERIEQTQINDRLSKVLAGRDTILSALKMEDENNKKNTFFNRSTNFIRSKKADRKGT